MRVTCDGQEYGDWAYLGSNRVEIRTMMAEHTFVVDTGYVGPTGVDSETMTRSYRSKL